MMIFKWNVVCLTDLIFFINFKSFSMISMILKYDYMSVLALHLHVCSSLSSASTRWRRYTRPTCCAASWPAPPPAARPPPALALTRRPGARPRPRPRLGCSRLLGRAGSPSGGGRRGRGSGRRAAIGSGGSGSRCASCAPPSSSRSPSCAHFSTLSTRTYPFNLHIRVHSVSYKVSLYLLYILY